MNTKTQTVLECMLVLLWHLPSSCVRGGGAMGPVVSLINPSFGTLMAICALEARTFLPTCWGKLPEDTPAPTSQPMWALTAGYDFICGLRYETHTPICWGGNPLVTSIPSAYASNSYSTINAGSEHVCAVRDNSSLSPGTVDCWGSNQFQQTVPPNVTMVSVTSGYTYSCGIIQASRKVVCWGEMDSVSRSQLPSDRQFKDIFFCGLQLCGIKLDGLTECRGVVSTIMSNPYPNRLFSSLVGTLGGTCGIDQLTHQVICWTIGNVPLTTPMAYPSSYLSVSEVVIPTKDGKDVLDFGYVCGVREDKEVGNLYCWGTFIHSFDSSLSSFTASKEICRDQCPSLSSSASSPSSSTPPNNKPSHLPSSSVVKIVVLVCIVVLEIFLI